MKKSYSIPIDLCKYILSNKGAIAYAKLYIYLKMFCSGHFKLTSENRVEISSDLGISKRTLRRNLDKLLKKNGLLIIQKMGIIGSYV